MKWRWHISTDTGVSGGFLGTNQTFPATMWVSSTIIIATRFWSKSFSYQFDVDPQTQTFANRRVFAYSDSGVPDGIQLDTMGNVYSGCGEATHVWNAEGTLIGKFYLNSTTAQMIFTKSGLVILDEEAIYLANIQAQGLDLTTL
jgi:gluconolactonase